MKPAQILKQFVHSEAKQTKSFESAKPVEELKKFVLPSVIESLFINYNLFIGLNQIHWCYFLRNHTPQCLLTPNVCEEIQRAK